MTLFLANLDPAHVTIREIDKLGRHAVDSNEVFYCLLYTSDAADERSSVDLGGRRIIKKKNTKKTELCTTQLQKQYNYNW